MPKPGYTLTAPVCETGDLVLSQAIRVRDGLSVLLKTPSATRPTPLLVARLEREFELTRDLDPSLIARPIALERHAGNVVLVLELGPTETLASRLGYPMDIRSFLEIAIGITAALAELHRHELVHKDLKPEHVLLDAAGHVWLTGLGIASRLPRERQAPEPPEIIAGTLAYMAPEQTGRMNRSIDSRCDLYALGVTFYEMLTGGLPFTASDPMEWVHCHIARQPVPPAHRVPNIPEPLSEMVMKLLAKTAEERYQSAVGLDGDLRRCLAEWASDGRIDSFPLGEHDASQRLLIPEVLYGRQSEIDALLAAFNRVMASGTAELVLVSGYSGVGKTSVVHELHKELVPPRGLFAAGKFDQYKRDIPYATLVQALGVLVRQILGKGEAEVAAWRAALHEAVSPNGQLIIGLIPEVELVIGKQPAVPELAPQEAQNRFQMVLRRFLGVFARPEHPLALFLDDLQWLDAATLDLIEQLVTGQEVRHLLLIGAYRDNEVGPTHPLMRIVEAIRKRGATVQEVVLAPLAIDDVTSLVADSLHSDRERALPLAQLVHEKTGGNPFFAIQFLTALAEEELLVFDLAAERWTWDMAHIRAKGYSDNVVDLMVGKLGRLPAATLEALEQLACLGNVAEIATLATVYGQSEAALHAALWEAARLGLVVRTGSTYAFLHDRVQEAAYALLPEDRRMALHLKIGRLLLAQYPPDVLAERVFEVVDQFNRCITLVTEIEELASLRRLNSAAGRKARGAVAYASARRYLEHAAALLPSDCWSDLYAESIALFTELAECEYLLGRFQHSEDLLTVALEKARYPLDRVLIYRLRQRLYQSSGRWPEAARAALEGLELLGVSFPENDDEIRSATEAEKRQIQANLQGRRIADLADIPFTGDPETQALIGLLAESITQFFITRPVLWHLIVLKCVNLCLEKGHVEESPYIYSSYCKMLVALYDDIPSAFEFSLMSMALNERRAGGFMKGLPPFFHASVVANWRQHFATNLSLFDQAFQAFLDSGDIIWASYLTYNAIWLHMENGDPLGEITERARRYALFNQRSHNDIVYIVDRIEEQFALSLQGKTRSLTDFSDDSFDEAASVAAIERARFGIGIGYYRISKQIAAFVAGDFDESLTWAERVAPVLASVSSMAIWGSHHFFYALTMAALHDRVGEEQRLVFARKLTAILERLKFWMDNCPENFANRHHLVSAELARIEGRDTDAMRLYDQAIASARDNDFVHQEAIAAEVASRFYRSRGFDGIADTYLRDAHAAYARWGAQGKVRQLEERHPQLLEEVPPLSPAATFAKGARELDLQAIIRASRAISGDIVLGDLLKTLMRIVLEAAGAQQGYLLLARNGGLSLAADARVENQNVVVDVRGDPGLPAALLPGSILDYVRRSRDKVLLDDATAGNPYSGDDYFSHRHPKSVLCFPITKQTNLIGVVYLENDLAAHVFRPDRLAVLELLAAQAAIALENALVYEALQASESRLNISQRLSRVGGWEFDVASGRSFWTEELYRIHELTADPGLDHVQESLKCYRPEDRPTISDAFRGVAERGEAYDLEFPFTTFKGKPLWIRTTAQPVFEHGAVVRVIGNLMDITERRLGEEALQRLNRELRAISTCNQVLVRATDEQALLDEICRIICDEAGYRMAWVGYAERDDAKTVRPVASAGVDDGYAAGAGITWEDTERGRGPIGTAVRTGQTSCIQDFTTDPEAAPWREAAAQRGYRSCVALTLKVEGATTFGALTIYSTEPGAFTPDEIRLLEELAGDLAFGITVLRTRAERDKVDEALRASEEQYRHFVEDDVTGVFITAPDGRVLTCNPAFARVLGFASVEEALATNVVSIYRDPAARASLLAEVRVRGRVDDREMAWRRLDGSPLTVVDTAIGDFDEGGELVAIRGYVIDITERRHLEDQLRQAQKMEAIGRLAGGVAHDFNNLLTAINGYADLALADTSDEARHEDIQEIRKAGERAAALTRQLLAFSRRQVLQPVVLDLNSVVAAIAPMLRRLVGEQIELRAPAAPDLGRVRADPSQIEQVLMNLVVNARDAMSAGGTLTIETANVELDEEYAATHATAVPGPYVMLAVTDTGAGMGPATMAHLFEPFFTTKPVGEGTGLGLATVYGIVAQSRGYVAAESEPGHGSAFRVYLPRVTADVDSQPASAAGTAVGGSETILVVEDEDAVRAYAERVLGRLGYAVFSVRSGAEALALVGDHPGSIDLLITDIMLPGLNGREISERLTAAQPSLRTLFISGYTEDSIIHQGVLEPGVAFLDKPFTPDALGRAVRDALGTGEAAGRGAGR